MNKKMISMFFYYFSKREKDGINIPQQQISHPLKQHLQKPSSLWGIKEDNYIFIYNITLSDQRIRRWTVKILFTN